MHSVVHKVFQSTFQKSSLDLKAFCYGGWDVVCVGIVKFFRSQVMWRLNYCRSIHLVQNTQKKVFIVTSETMNLDDGETEDKQEM